MIRAIVDPETGAIDYRNADGTTAFARTRPEWTWQAGSPLEQCPHCQRMRLAWCVNGKRRCEKCDYSPEVGRALTDEELETFDGPEDRRHVSRETPESELGADFEDDPNAKPI